MRARFGLLLVVLVCGLCSGLRVAPWGEGWDIGPTFALAGDDDGGGDSSGSGGGGDDDGGDSSGSGGGDGDDDSGDSSGSGGGDGDDDSSGSGDGDDDRSNSGSGGDDDDDGGDDDGDNSGPGGGDEDDEDDEDRRGRGRGRGGDDRREERRAPEPAAAVIAPRITLGSGSAPSFRQLEVSALGLTPRARQVARGLGYRIISERRSALLGNRVVARLRTPGTQSPEASLRQLRQLLPDVIFDFTHLYRPSQDGGPVPVRYGAELVGFAPGACRVDARVGLIDTGVGRHASLKGARISGRDFVGEDATRNVAHGTAVASILVGDLPGVEPLAPGARLFSANVFAGEGGVVRSDAAAIIAALDWLAGQRVGVVNLSLMGPANALLEAAVQAAAARGMVLIAAAGNEGPGAAPVYPAAYGPVVAVAAVDARSRPYSHNNRGSYIDIAAPGVDIWGADARGGEAFWTGSSFAVPFATAAIAREIADGRVRDVNGALSALAAGARDLGAPGRDPVYGYGLLQATDC